MIWRDDDILFPGTRLDDLLAADDLLQTFGQRHTIVIIAETLTADLARVIRDRQMVPQLHCWAHDDLSVNATATAQLGDAIMKIEDLIGQRPTVLYPPWNRTSPVLEATAAGLGLTVSTQKLSLDQVIRVKGAVPRDSVVNFHYWHAPDRDALARALAFVPPATQGIAGARVA